MLATRCMVVQALGRVVALIKVRCTDSDLISLNIAALHSISPASRSYLWASRGMKVAHRNATFLEILQEKASIEIKSGPDEEDDALAEYRLSQHISVLKHTTGS